MNKNFNLEHYYSNINGKEEEKIFLNDKKVTKGEYKRILKNYEKENKKDKCDCDNCTCEEKTTIKEQSELDYYTSKDFNIFETVDFLSKHSDWKAENDICRYKYIKTEEGVERFVVDNDEESKVIINNKTLNWMFKLIPPEEKEEWIDCDAITAIRKYNNYEKIKVICNNEEYIYDSQYNEDEYQHLTSNIYHFIINEDYKWQYLKK